MSHTCQVASRPQTEARVKSTRKAMLNIVRTETDVAMSLMVLLILSKGAQRRKSGEKRKDRKKEATEEEKGCPEKEKLVARFLQMDRSALCSGAL